MTHANKEHRMEQHTRMSQDLLSWQVSAQQSDLVLKYPMPYTCSYIVKYFCTITFQNLMEKNQKHNFFLQGFICNSFFSKHNQGSLFPSFLSLPTSPPSTDPPPTPPTVCSPGRARVNFGSNVFWKEVNIAFHCLFQTKRVQNLSVLEHFKSLQHILANKVNFDAFKYQLNNQLSLFYFQPILL